MNFISTKLVMVFLFTALSFNVLGQDAKIIKLSEWGSGQYIGVAELNGLHYLNQGNSNIIDIYDTSKQGKESLIYQLSMPDIVHEVSVFDGKLVLIYGHTLTLLDPVNPIAPTEIFAISIDDTNYEYDAIYSNNNQLVYLTSKNKVYLIEKNENGYAVEGTYQGEKNDADYNIWRRSVGINDNTIYFAYNKFYKTDPANAEVVMIELKKNSGVLESTAQLTNNYEGSIANILYIEDSRFIVASSFKSDVIGKKNNILTTIASKNQVNYSSESLAFANNTLWTLLSSSTIKAYDYSDVLNPTLLSTSELAISNGSEIHAGYFNFIDGDLFIAENNGLHKVAVEGSSISSIQSFFHQGGYAGLSTIIGNTLFIPKGNRIDILNVSDPKNPILQEQYELNTTNEYLGFLYKVNNYVYRIGYNDARVYEINGESLENTGVVVNTGGALVKFSESKMFSTQVNRKLLQYNIEQPNSLYEVPNEVLYSAADEEQTCCFALEKIDIANGFLIGIDSSTNHRIHLFSDYDSDTISYSGFQDVNSDITDFAVSGNYIYSIDGDKIVIHEMSNNGIIFEVGTVPLTSDIIHLQVSPIILDDYLALAANTRVSLFDLSNPVEPTFVSTSEFPEFDTWYTGDIYVSQNDGIIYKSNRTSGRVQIYQINKAPHLNPSEFTLNEDSDLTIDVSPMDLEGDVIDITVTSAPHNGELFFNVDKQELSYYPATDFFGNDITTIELVDEHGNSSEAHMNISVIAVDDPPKPELQNKSVIEGSTMSGALATTDVDGEKLSYTILQHSTNGTLELANDGAYNYTPNAGYTGADSFTFEAKDENGNTAEGKVSITVNLKPVTVNPQKSSGGGSLGWLALTAVFFIYILQTYKVPIYFNIPKY